MNLDRPPVFRALRLAPRPPSVTAAPSPRAPSVLSSNAEFKVLYDAHFPLVWRALSQFGVRQSDLMDLTQKVFLTAFLKLPSFEGRSQLSTWLWGICRRVAIAHRRSGAMRYEVTTDPLAVEGWLDPGGTSPASDSALASEAAVEHLLSKLSHSQRVVFTLSEVNDMDGRQIAALLDVSLGTVRSRLRYARERIQREVRRLTAAQRFTNQPQRPRAAKAMQRLSRKPDPGDLKRAHTVKRCATAPSPFPRSPAGP
ncbi:MAG: sigma-70 family RNA polymerase sigma factor [Myxococcales bacterium]